MHLETIAKPNSINNQMEITQDIYIYIRVVQKMKRQEINLGYMYLQHKERFGQFLCYLNKN